MPLCVTLRLMTTLSPKTVKILALEEFINKSNIGIKLLGIVSNLILIFCQNNYNVGANFRKFVKALTRGK